MKKIIIGVIAVLLLMAGNLLAEDADLIVDGKLGVGTGTTIPGEQLHVFGSNAAIRIQDSGANGRPWNLWSYSDGKLYISDRSGSGGDRLTIDTIGNVGIGTASPGNKFEVQGANNLVTIVGRAGTSTGQSFGEYLSDDCHDIVDTFYCHDIVDSHRIC